MGGHHHHDGDHDDFGGLHRDLLSTGSAMDRRQLFRMALGLGALNLLGCSSSALTDASSSSTTTTETTGSTTCSKIPNETEGPYPGDGSNGPNVLTSTGVVRSDIRSSFAGLSGTADGVAMQLIMTIKSATTCSPLASRAVYVWHCDRPGRYSLYSSGVTNQNYLRGVQQTDANGQVTFTSIFPACYSGRWPHIHFEVYPSLAAATSVSNKNATSQIALPKSACDLVYATTGYEASVSNLRQVSLSSDMVFADGYALETPSVTGSAATGFVVNQSVFI